MISLNPEEIYLVSVFRGKDQGETVSNLFDALSELTDEGYKEMFERALSKLIAMSDDEYIKIPFDSVM